MSKKLAKSFGFKAVHISVLMLYNLLLIPVLLNFWDLKVYGAWIAIYVFFNLIQVLELGHSTYVGNEINRVALKDPKRAKELLGSALRANFIVSGLQPVIVFVIYKLGLFTYFLDSDIDQKEVATVLLILFVYRMSIGSFRGLIQKVLNPYGLIYRMFQYSLIEKILEFGILVTAAVTKVSLTELAILWLAVKMIFSIVILYDLKRLLPQFFPWWRYGSLSLGIKNMNRSFSFVLSNFLDRLGNDGIVLVVSAVVGTTYLPLFAATRTLVNFGLKLSDFFLNPIAPEMINLYAEKKLKLILNIFKSYWVVSGTILISAFMLSLLFIESLFTVWTNNKLSFDLELYSALIVIFLIQNYGKVLLSFFIGINKTGIILWASIIRIVFFFGFALLFMQYQLYAVLGALILAELVVVSGWLPYHAMQLFTITGINKLSFYLNLFTALVVGLFFYINYAFGFTLTSVILVFIIVGLLYLEYRLIDSQFKVAIQKRMLKIVTFGKK